jgi:hypothetical protein
MDKLEFNNENPRVGIKETSPSERLNIGGQQTAVEWFMEKIGEKQPNGMYVIDTLEDIQNVFHKAKAMEKEQIMNAYSDGLNVDLSITPCFHPQYYYKETYGE